MDNTLDLALLLCTFLLALFVIFVWSCEIFAFRRSRPDEDYFRKSIWLAGLVFFFSPAILLLHGCTHLFKILSHVMRYVLFSLVALVAVLASPAIILAIPLVFLILKLVQIAEPIGNQIYNLSLDFFDQLEFWLGGRKQERQP